ncbi:MAG: S1 family peptidase [bacterium]
MRSSRAAASAAYIIVMAAAFWPALLRGQQGPAISSVATIPDDIYQRAVQAVVKVSVGDKKPAGAGLVIGKTRNGLPVILTANALINGHEDKITIQAAGRGQAAPGRLISAKWRNRDLVLIAARKALPVTAALPYGHSDQIAPGEDVAVLGFPQANLLAQNNGQVVRNEISQIMLNLISAEGQTGGPVLDKNGHVIGLAVSRPQELAQALPIDLARIVLQQWLGKTQLAEPWQEGKTSKNWQGWLVATGLLIATGVAVGVSGVF